MFDKDLRESDNGNEKKIPRTTKELLERAKPTTKIAIAIFRDKNYCGIVITIVEEGKKMVFHISFFEKSSHREQIEKNVNGVINNW